MAADATAGYNSGQYVVQKPQNTRREYKKFDRAERAARKVQRKIRKAKLRKRKAAVGKRKISVGLEVILLLVAFFADIVQLMLKALWLLVILAPLVWAISFFLTIVIITVVLLTVVFRGGKLRPGFSDGVLLVELMPFMNLMPTLTFWTWRVIKRTNRIHRRAMLRKSLQK